jgi:four helix bundle protein
MGGMPQIESFRDLIVWQKSMDLSVRCYLLTRRFPRRDQLVLGYQIQKSALSIPSNVSEGHERRSTRAYINHLRIANGSGAELQTQLETAKRVFLITETEAKRYIEDAIEIGRMLGGLIAALKRKRLAARRKSES